MMKSDGIPRLIRLLAAEQGSELTAVSADGWGALIRLAAEHDVAPLLHARLQSLDVVSLVPAEARRALMGHYAASALRNRWILREAAVVLRALREAGIPVIVLKGAHLASEVYGEVALRPMYDIDLLVREDLETRAESVMQDIGYRRADGSGIERGSLHHLPRLYKEGCAPVEIHRGLAPRYGALRMDSAGVFDRARSIAVSGTPALGLSPDDLVLHLSLHVSHGHGFQVPLRSLYDIVAVLHRHADTLDWTQLTDRANREGASGYLYSTLGVVQRLFATPVPAEQLERFAHGAVDREVVEVAVRFIEGGAPAMPLLYRQVVDGDGWGERVRLLGSRIFSDPPSPRRATTSRSRLPYWLGLSGRLVLDLAQAAPRLRRAWHREQQRRRIRRWQRRPNLH
jgi:hypothetical protein